jgi:hypothetical protein
MVECKCLLLDEEHAVKRAPITPALCPLYE